MLRSRMLTALTLALAILALCGSITGIASGGAVYARNVEAYAIQALATDWGNVLVVIPLLLVTAFFMRKGSKRAAALWFGTLLYAIYLFFYDMTTIAFNRLFIVYAAEAGTAVYAVLIALRLSTEEKLAGWFPEHRGRLPTALLLGFLGIFFMGLWLSELIPASIAMRLPHSCAIQGLQTAVFQGLDIGIFFPGFLVAAGLLLAKRRFGEFLGPAYLFFTTVMSICLVILDPVTAARVSSYTLRPMTAVFAGTALICGAFTFAFLRGWDVVAD